MQTSLSDGFYSLKMTGMGHCWGVRSKKGNMLNMFCYVTAVQSYESVTIFLLPLSHNFPMEGSPQNCQTAVRTIDIIVIPNYKLPFPRSTMLVAWAPLHKPDGNLNHCHGRIASTELFTVLIWDHLVNVLRRS